MKGTAEDPWDEHDMDSFFDEAEEAFEWATRAAIIYFIVQILVVSVFAIGAFWVILKMLTAFGIL